MASRTLGGRYTVQDKIGTGGMAIVYRGIDDVKFKNTVRPGDLCEVTCRIDENKAGIFHCSAKLEVGGKLCCRGKLTFAVIPDPMKAAEK